MLSYEDMQAGLIQLGAGQVISNMDHRASYMNSRVAGSSTELVAASPYGERPVNETPIPGPSRQRPQSSVSHSQTHSHPHKRVQVSSTLAANPTTGGTKLLKNAKNPYRATEIIKPIDRAAAQQRKQYDPRTIARDVLVASGRHATEPPLNHHLEFLKTRFPNVDNSADLSTFRWDIVDPGGPPVVPANRPPVVPDLVSSTPLSFVSNSSINTPGFRLPTDRESMQQLLFPKSSPFTPPFTFPTSRGLIPTRGSSYSRGVRGRRRPTGKIRAPAHPSSVSKSPVIIPDIVSPSVVPSSSTVHPSGPSKPVLDVMPTSGVKRGPGRPPRNHDGTTESSKLPKRPEAIAKAIRGALSNSAQPESPRKDSITEILTDLKAPAPAYVPFICEWKDCPAELHNLQTLRKHVAAIHIETQPSSDCVCLWAKCGIYQNTREFDDLHALERHVEKRHMVPFAWYLGDGPRDHTKGRLNPHQLLRIHADTRGREQPVEHLGIS
jgi:hypothetical protein